MLQILTNAGVNRRVQLPVVQKSPARALPWLRFGSDQPAEPEKPAIPTPRIIKNFLDRFVIGQERAKKILSTVIREHLMRYLKWERHNKWDMPPAADRDRGHLIQNPAGGFINGTFIGPNGQSVPAGSTFTIIAQAPTKVSPKQVGAVVNRYYDMKGEPAKMESFVQNVTTMLQTQDLKSASALGSLKDMLKQADADGLIHHGAYNKFQLKALANQVFRPEEDPDYSYRIFSKMILNQLQKAQPAPPTPVAQFDPHGPDEDTEPYGDVSALPWILAEERAKAEAANPDALKDTPMLDKNNVLLVGSSGSGKTYIIQTMLDFINQKLGMKIPLIIEDATQFTEAGYVGKHIDQLGSRLLEEADGDVASAQWGIIYFDEMDKKLATGETGRDVAGIGVQQSLLRIMEKGGRISASYQGKTRDLDMSNVLFLTGGAFSQGLTDIIRDRLGKKSMGFHTSGDAKLQEHLDDDNNALHEVEPQDLVRYGLLKEFVGRLGSIVTFDKPSRTMLKRILSEPDNSMTKQFQGQLKHEGVELEFEDKALDEIADYASKMDTGARSLRAILNKVTEDIRFDAPDLPPGTKYVVTQDMVKTALTPRYLRNQSS